MWTFTIDTDNNITAHGTEAEANNHDSGAEHFTTAKQLARLADKWPASRLVEIWNSLAGQKPVKKFTSRDKAVARIWTAIQSLAPDGGAQVAPEPAKKGKPSKQASPPGEAALAREGSKTTKILELLKRPGGASLQDIMAYASHCTSLA